MTKGFFKDIQYCPVPRAVRRALAGDYIGERSDLNALFADFNLNGPAAETIQGSRAMDASHEIDLEIIVIANQTNQIRSGILGPEERRAQRIRNSFQLRQICGRSPDEEIEVDGGYGRALQSSSCIADQNRLQLVLSKGASNGNEQRPSVHELLPGAVAILRRFIRAAPFWAIERIGDG
ncbi:MAG TPA: hypothetical protein VG345_15620, partial [Bryobacteraceae bacterium]|nr:hypothetical protein [Bryobacteraceae bacterium]